MATQIGGGWTPADYQDDVETPSPSSGDKGKGRADPETSEVSEIEQNASLRSLSEAVSHSPIPPNNSPGEAPADWNQLSEAKVKALSPQDLERAMGDLSVEHFKHLQRKMSPEQLRRVRRIESEFDRELGIGETKQNSDGRELASERQRPPTAAPDFQAGIRSTKPNKLRKPRPGTENYERVSREFKTGQGMLARAIDLKTARNMDEKAVFPKAGAIVSVATSPRLLGKAVQKKICQPSSQSK